MVAGVFALAVASWAAALARDLAGSRHVTAKSLRLALGPPAPVDGSDVVIPTAIEAEPPPPPVRPAGLEGVSFVLLLGTDNRKLDGIGRTDAMILAGFRDRDGAVAAISVPRDLWVPLPDVGTLHAEGRTHARLSSVYRVGELRLGRGQGMALLRQTLEAELGVRVDRYASIDFAGFEALVDALGGVEVEVACPIMDCFWVEGTDKPCVMMEVPAGTVRLDGATALAFVRSRHGTGDRDRRRRQQSVMLGFARKLRGAGVRGIHRLWGVAEAHVDTDLARGDAIYYGSFGLETRPAQVHGFSIKHPMTARHVTEDGKHVLLLDRGQFDAALDGLFEAELPAVRGRSKCPAPDAAL